MDRFTSVNFAKQGGKSAAEGRKSVNLLWVVSEGCKMQCGLVGL